VAVIPGANLATAMAIADRVRSDLDDLRLAHDASSSAPFDLIHATV